MQPEILVSCIILDMHPSEFQSHEVIERVIKDLGKYLSLLAFSTSEVFLSLYLLDPDHLHTSVHLIFHDYVDRQSRNYDKCITSIRNYLLLCQLRIRRLLEDETFELSGDLKSGARERFQEAIITNKIKQSEFDILAFADNDFIVNHEHGEDDDFLLFDQGEMSNTKKSKKKFKNNDDDLRPHRNNHTIQTDNITSRNTNTSKPSTYSNSIPKNIIEPKTNFKKEPLLDKVILPHEFLREYIPNRKAGAQAFGQALSRALCICNSLLEYSKNTPSAFLMALQKVPVCRTLVLTTASNENEDRMLSVSHITVNAGFAARRLGMPIDVAVLPTGTENQYISRTLLDLTVSLKKSLFICAEANQDLLPLLVQNTLPHTALRGSLTCHICPVSESNDHFNTGLFCECHGKSIGVGLLCSICLRLHCVNPEISICENCGSHFDPGVVE